MRSSYSRQRDLGETRRLTDDQDDDVEQADDGTTTATAAAAQDSPRVSTSQIHSRWAAHADAQQRHAQKGRSFRGRLVILIGCCAFPGLTQCMCTPHCTRALFSL